MINMHSLGHKTACNFSQNCLQALLACFYRSCGGEGESSLTGRRGYFTCFHHLQFSHLSILEVVSTKFATQGSGWVSLCAVCEGVNFVHIPSANTKAKQYETRSKPICVIPWVSYCQIFCRPDLCWQIFTRVNTSIPTNQPFAPFAGSTPMLRIVSSSIFYANYQRIMFGCRPQHLWHYETLVIPKSETLSWTQKPKSWFYKLHCFLIRTNPPTINIAYQCI